MRRLAVDGAWEIDLRPHHDERGIFAEWYSDDEVSALLGAPMPVALAGVSISRKGVVRGVHFVETPPGQARYVTCVAGEVRDFVVDVREGSPTFGRWDSVRLGPGHWRAVYLAEGLGHAFTALTDHATVLYLCSAPYRPERERTVHPLDPALALPWPAGAERSLSARDREAPTLAEARRRGLLPAWSATVSRSTVDTRAGSPPRSAPPAA
ncbi:dTDP-4-dehydrorhamnose 3,5-epimerase family protein [Streptomyces tsukubensis]|uniref:dTDP-4-dehydrorhamnose 3,5-epimerase n=1 Tax=Streptomyces tsukubensis TaxID=83656 RepID=A0A1V4AAS1_9ACTN|nr:dTDP-4-dehydrorhamnose 3,5-epimerase [Streptomyces tsukubensis]OON80930.1 dTDP-4-dehydrorhamnose 3,5-epimerase [Streptomyces tsukubensis]